MIMSPCKDCTDRYAECHCDCKNYKNWKEELEKEKVKINQVKSKAYELYAYGRCRHEKIYLRYIKNNS